MPPRFLSATHRLAFTLTAIAGLTKTGIALPMSKAGLILPLVRRLISIPMGLVATPPSPRTLHRVKTLDTAYLSLCIPMASKSAQPLLLRLPMAMAALWLERGARHLISLTGHRSAQWMGIITTQMGRAGHIRNTTSHQSHLRLRAMREKRHTLPFPLVKMC